MEITKSVEYVCWSEVTKCFCLTKLLTDKIFSPTKHNPGELNAKVPDHTGSQSHAYILERVSSNKYAFFVIAYQKQLNKIQMLRLDCRLKKFQHLSRASPFLKKG